jgi:rod shape-determining protein MreC
MLILGILSISLMAVDHFSDYLDGIRSALTVVATPVLFTANLPKVALSGAEELVESRQSMRQHIDSLEQEQLLLRAQTEQMAALIAENNRLRALLGSAAKLQDNVLVAELMGIDPDPNRHEVILDKGLINGVFVGQPVLDAQGLMGQIIEVSRHTSRVLLISDIQHSVPVQVNRSNLRLIARGTGVTRQLELMHVQATADIRKGDLLVSSGLGNRFPVGYPVGVVNSIEYDPGKPFINASALPSARLERSRHVLLVFTEARLEQLGDDEDG